MPVCPSCFCTTCPMGSAPPMRLPAPMMPMSFMVTPPSASAPWTACEARSVVSRSGCFPNLVMWIPRTHTSSDADAIVLTSQGFETEADCLGAVVVGADHVGRQADLHAQRHVFGIGCHVDEIGLHAGAVAVDDSGHVGHGDPRGGEGDDGESPHLAARRDIGLLEICALAGRAGVAAIEEAGAARGALVRHQMRVVSQLQVVDQRDLLRHHAPSLKSEIVFSM